MQKKFFIQKKFNVFFLRSISNIAYVLPISNDNFRNKKENKFKYLPLLKKQKLIKINKFPLIKNRQNKNSSLKINLNKKKLKFFIKKKFYYRKRFKKKKKL